MSHIHALVLCYLFFMLLIQGERSLVSDVTWLYNCGSLKRRPTQRNKKNNTRSVGLKCSEITILSFQKQPINTSPVRLGLSWVHPLTCVRCCWCCFPSDSLNEGTAEWGQRRKRRVSGTDPTGKWPRVIFLLSLSFDFFFFEYYPPSSALFVFFIICHENVKVSLFWSMETAG